MPGCTPDSPGASCSVLPFVLYAGFKTPLPDLPLVVILDTRVALLPALTPSCWTGGCRRSAPPAAPLPALTDSRAGGLPRADVDVDLGHNYRLWDVTPHAFCTRTMLYTFALCLSCTLHLPFAQRRTATRLFWIPHTFTDYHSVNLRFAVTRYGVVPHHGWPSVAAG